LKLFKKEKSLGTYPRDFVQFPAIYKKKKKQVGSC
jgi:hypothetical protein